jgi:SAM-dependent methyltransferase
MICRVCSGENVGVVLDLGEQPHCNTLIPPEHAHEAEPVYPLRLCFCHDCTTAQIDHTVPKETMFSWYPYVSGTTQTLRDHFDDSAGRLIERLQLGKEDMVVDIGSNDGTWLKAFARRGVGGVGVEPAENVVSLARADGVETLHRFFDASTARDILDRFGAPSLVTAAGVFFHLEELQSATEGAAILCEAGASFCIQAIYLGEMLSKNHFDNIYHEHLTYWSLTSISHLLDLHGLEVFDVSLLPIHGGTMEYLVGRKGVNAIEKSVSKLRQEEIAADFGKIDTYRAFAERVWGIRTRLLAILEAYKSAGKTVYAFGAPAKGATMLNSFGIDTAFLDCATERNPLKFDQLMPGSRLPIVNEETVEPPDAYLVLPWNFLGEFLSRNREYIMGGGAFIVPLPEPHVITSENFAEYNLVSE